MMTIPDIIPWQWKAGAAVALVAAAAAAVLAYGAHKYDAGHEAAISERAAQDAVAIINRTTDNAAKAAQQVATNIKITKVQNEEMDPVRHRIADAPRVRVGAAICPGGPAATTEAASAAGSDQADPPGRLVRQDVDGDIRALKLQVEEDLATGRACQRFLDENGLHP